MSQSIGFQNSAGLNYIQLIQLTQLNSVPGQPNRMRLQLPFPFDCRNNDVALSNCFIYYSWQNITVGYGNNSFSYVFNGVTYSQNLPAGFYSVSDLNGYLQLAMQQAGQYLVDQNGNNVYFLSLTANPVYYAVTLTATPIPSVLPTGWTNPNAVGLSGVTPQLVVTTAAFGLLIGYTVGSYPPSPQGTEYQTNGTITAQISPTTSVNINTNMVSNSKFNSTSPQAIFTFSPNVQYTSQIIISPQNLLWFRAVDQVYSFIDIFFTDQNNQALNILDTNIVVNILLRPKGVFS